MRSSGSTLRLTLERIFVELVAGGDALQHQDRRCEARRVGEGETGGRVGDHGVERGEFFERLDA